MFSLFKTSKNEPRDKKSNGVDNLHRVDFRSGGVVRRSRLRGIFRVSTVIIALLAVGIGGKLLLDRLVLQHPDYLIQGITVETDGSLSNESILEAAGVEGAENLFLLRIGKARTRLESLAQVRSAEVVRSIPGVLKIRVKEHKPIAWLSAPDAGAFAHTSQNGVLLTEDKIAFPCNELRPDLRKLPVINVTDIAKVPFGYPLESSQIDQGVELVNLHKEMMFGFQIGIDEIFFERRFGIKVEYRNQAVVRYSRSDLVDAVPLHSQVRDFRSVIEYALEERRQLATLDLRVRKNVPATFFDNKPAAMKARELEDDQAESMEVDGIPIAKPVWRPSDVNTILGSLY